MDGVWPILGRMSRLAHALAERAEYIVFEWIILAALAAVILYQLYATLGRRVGRQPEDAPAAVPANAPAPGTVTPPRCTR